MIYIQCFQKIPSSRLISTFFVHLERVAPSTHCLSKPKHLQSIFCLCPWAEVATDLWNNGFNLPVLVLLLLSHSAIFDSTGLVLLKTFSYLPFTALHHLCGPCVSDHSSLSFNFLSFPKWRHLPLKSSFCFSLTLFILPEQGHMFSWLQLLLLCLLQCLPRLKFSK